MVMLENAHLPDHTLDNIVLQLISTGEERNAGNNDACKAINISLVNDKKVLVENTLNEYKNQKEAGEKDNATKNHN